MHAPAHNLALCDPKVVHTEMYTHMENPPGKFYVFNAGDLLDWLRMNDFRILIQNKRFLDYNKYSVLWHCE